MLGRRDVIRAGALGLLLTSAGGLMEACGSKPGAPVVETGAAGGIRLVSADVTRAAGDPALIGPVVSGLDDFAARLYDAVAAGQRGNLVISPYSVAVALSMTLAGAHGTTASQLATALGADGLGGRWHQAMNTLTAYVDGLAGPTKRADGSKATLGLTTADALFGQRGLVWQKAFLEVLARDYGAGMRTVDFANPDHVADLIDAWVADNTDDRIKDLIPHGALTADDRLVLVNAVSLTAPWETPFDKASTRPGDFHLDDGSTVQVPMMTKTEVPIHLVQGDGWRAARIPYAGSTLAMTVVVPNRGQFAAVEGALTRGALRTAPDSGPSTSAVLTLPRWTSRTSVSLKQALQGLGVTDAFTDHADFGGMTTQDALAIADVLHQGYIKVDEDGTEAAAATAVVAVLSSLPVAPRTFTADRPFLYVLHDTAHGTPLFLGRVTDPTR